MSQVAISHASLISTVDAYYRAILDLDYLREDEVQFPPHRGEGKVPLAIAQIQKAGLTPEAEQLLHYLPYVTESGIEPYRGSIGITPGHSEPVTCLKVRGGNYSTYGRRFGLDHEAEEVSLPPWIISVFQGIHRDANCVFYDTRNRTIAELSIYEPTQDAFEMNATSPEDLIGKWVQNLHTLSLVPWRDDNMARGFECLTSEASCPTNPERLLSMMTESMGALTPDHLDTDPAGSWHHVRWEDLSWELENAKECHNKYWAKRFAFERAGWPHALDKNILRAHVGELEQGERDANDEFWAEVRKVNSDWRANNQAHNAKWREIEKEYWRKAAGTRGM